MTVHRAKGLEFDTVIVPELQRGVQSDRRPLLLVHQPGGEPPLPPIPVALPAAGTPGDALFSCLMQHNRDAAGSESLRLLYVALTRARESLHLYRDPAQRRAPDSFLAMLHASVAADEPPPPAAVADEDGRAVGGHAARAPLRRRLARLPATPVPPPPAPVTRPPLPFEWASPLARPIGTVTHRYLQVLAEAGDPAPALPARSALQVALREQGLRGTELMHAVQEVESLLRATLASTRGRWLLSGAHRDARSELRLTTRTGVGQVGDLVIDRTFVTADGVRWIVDYKTGNHEGGDLATFLESEVLRYRPQLEAYARALAVLDTAPIRLGLYYPRLDAWREWAAGDTT
jgi:ATP-dependent exoDNAse (exonuclease V) beta subunit